MIFYKKGFFKFPTEMSVKREHSASGEGTATKRQKILPKSSTSEKLTEAQIQDLLSRTIQLTDNWTSEELESLYSSLELVMENSEDDAYLSMTECLTHFQESRNATSLGREENSSLDNQR